MRGRVVLAVTLAALGVALAGDAKKVLLINDEDGLSTARTYSFEDFFWTGSGDGPLPPVDKSGHPTIIRTTTVLATVFLDSSPSLTTDSSLEEDCVSECPINPATGQIDPTRVDGSDEDSYPSLPDQKYWLLTVLRAPAAPLPPSLSRSLARLYQRAFMRQQQQHLGIITSSAVSHRKKHHINSKTSKGNESVQFDQSEVFDLDLNISASSTENYSESYEVYLNSTMENIRLNYANITPKVKRSIKNLTENINIILLKNYSRDDPARYNDALDVVKRQIGEDLGQPIVEVFLHNLTRENSLGTKDEVKVVYWVSVGGSPVPAQTAARDMKLLADAEVVAELGYPITTKAEPYLKSSDAPDGILEASNWRDVWIIIVGILLAVVLFLSLISLLACRVVNRRKSSGTSRVLQTSGIDEKQVRYPSDFHGRDNKAYLEEEKSKKLIGVPYSDRKRTDERYVTSGYKSKRLGSPGSSSSTQSASDLSQMTATLRHKQRLFEKQMQNDYAIVNKRSKSKHKKIRSKKVGIVDDSFEADSACGIPDRFAISSPSSPSSSSYDSVVIRRPQGVISPTSYLSMPSVKSFPRGNAVEPLSRVLEPLSVKHLDMDSDSPVHVKVVKTDRGDQAHVLGSKINLIRTGSLDKDPGVIGPLVWDLHRQRIEKDAQVSTPNADNVIESNISKMRQRFSELVDDAFSLFGSGNSSPKANNNIEDVQHKPKSKVLNDAPAVSDDRRRHSAKMGLDESLKPPDDRPHTGLPPRPPLPQQHFVPTSAWSSNSSTPMVRSASAGKNRRPTIDVTLANDPAIPLIRAIKKELDKLPGTSDA